MATRKGIERLNIGLTHEAADTLERLRHVLAKQLGKRNLTINHVASWAVHYWLAGDAGGDKALLKALLAGKERQESILKGDHPGGNPGSGGNGKGKGSRRAVFVGAGGSERILAPRPVLGGVNRGGGKLAQSDKAIPAPQF